MSWHAHEMIYGFVMAAIAGFLLTAVPSWTGARGFAAKPLMAAVALWLAGRIAMSMAGESPFWVLALPSLRSFLCSSRCWRRRSFARAIAISHCSGCSGALDHRSVFLAAFARTDATLAAGSMRLAIDFVLVLITVIGGRIVPAFTANAFAGAARNRGS